MAEPALVGWSARMDQSDLGGKAGRAAAPWRTPTGVGDAQYDKGGQFLAFTSAEDYQDCRHTSGKVQRSKSLANWAVRRRPRRLGTLRGRALLQ